MLQYLIQVTQNLFVPCMIAALIYAYIKGFGGKSGTILNVGTLLGLAAAIIMAYFKQTTNKVDAEMWNIRITGISLLASAVFLVFSNGFILKKAKKVGECGSVFGAAAVMFMIMIDSLPLVMLYPWGFLQAGESMLSTEYIFKFTGFLFGIILMIVAVLAVYRGAMGNTQKTNAFFVKTVILVNVVRLVGRCLNSLKIRIRTGHIKGKFAVDMSSLLNKKPVLSFTRFVSNKQDVFVYIFVVIVLLIPIMTWIKSFKANEPYDNPAQHRKIRAKWRSKRRWASTAVICCVLSVLNLTAVKAYTERGVELSPVEECEQKDGNMYVYLDQVNDGHLHRFAYYTKDKTEIRFIVIKKPNSQAYGIGLDACDICGKTGYYEKNDQVVCNRCDVVMNINTIGFKGGCNPIPIEYKIENGAIIVPISVLEGYEKTFK